MQRFLAISLSVGKKKKSILLFVFFLLLFPISIAIFFVECVAAFLPNQGNRRHNTIDTPRPTVAILVPAHDEELGIAQTLTTLLPQLTAQDQLVVIADNCSDRTAQICRNLGVTVLERFNQQDKGKGYALDHGLQFLQANPPDVVIVFDADCYVHPGSVDKLAKLAKISGRPVQPINLLNPPAEGTPKSIISALAFMVKNLVRPSGLQRLGLPCLLTMGTAFPWSVISQAPLATNNLVEDMQLGIDLAIAGTSPLFCAEARVTGVLPQKEQAASSQKIRWIHGHLQTMQTQVPRLFKEAFTQRRFELLAIALDLCVPPLSLLTIAWIMILSGGIVQVIVQHELTIVILALLEGFLLLVAIIGAWAKFSRNDIPLKTLLKIPFYLLWKIPIYLAFLFKPQQSWVRTERDININGNQIPNLALTNNSILPTTFSLSSKIRAVKEQVLSEIASETEAILFHVQSGSYYTLNEVGTFIWTLIQEPQTIADLYNLIITEYAVSPEACLDDLLMVLEELSIKELIEVRNDFAT
jgi:cellulose synthase/poly-beta-1,6-N-acetylglucosamine synthase-like glycosyltransferase